MQAAQLQTDAISESLRAVQAAERRLATTAFRLARANRDRCANAVPTAGIALHSLSAYQASWRPAVTQTLGLVAGTGIIALAEEAPAAAAGLRAGDRLVSIDGESVPIADGSPSQSETDGWRASLRRALADGRARIVVTRDGAEVVVDLIGAPACPFEAQLELSDRYIAAANGSRIRLSTFVLAFAADDSELAAVIAHELAHNILHQPAQRDAAGVNMGLARALGFRAGRLRAAELEADRLSVRLMAAAGYDPAAALRYMERLVRRPDYQEGPTHPSAAQRIDALREAISSLAGL